MFSRIINCDIQLSRINDFRAAINDEFLPRIQAQPGFLENIESLDSVTGKYCCVTLWESESDLKSYDGGLFQEIAAKLVPMMAGNPSVQTLPVDNASAQNPKGGAAIAA